MSLPDFTGQHVVVVGLGDTGLSCARWLAAHGARVSVADSRSEPPHALRLATTLPGVDLHAGPFDAALLRAADLLVVSPGVPLATPEIRAALEAGVPVAGDVELLAQTIHAHRATRPMRVIAITGSNGKSTVTAMCGDMVEHCGKRVCVAGNFGLPVLDALYDMETGALDWPEVWVLELSSFQLETTVSLAADAATVLNISEDHLDRYPGLDAYARAKEAVFNGAGTMVLNRDDARVMAMARAGRTSVSFGLSPAASESEYGVCEGELCRDGDELMPLADLKVAGLHNAANALAALALTRAIGLEDACLLAGLARFKGLPHRVEFVAHLDGVDFYDDSKGTNVGATEAALYGLGERRAVVILGGEGKGQDFTPLAAALAANGRAAVLIGRDAALIDAAIAGSGVARVTAASMDEAVALAASLARPGDAVLLSPACASFDMFRNYAHRAQVFIDAVMRRVAERGRV